MPVRTACRVTTTVVDDVVIADCCCGWQRRVERCSSWPDGLPLRSPAERQRLAEIAAQRHVSRPGKSSPS